MGWFLDIKTSKIFIWCTEGILKKIQSENVISCVHILSEKVSEGILCRVVISDVFCAELCDGVCSTSQSYSKINKAIEYLDNETLIQITFTLSLKQYKLNTSVYRLNRYEYYARRVQQHFHRYC